MSNTTNIGAITPEDLEALHEDALVMGDMDALTGMYEPRVALVFASGERSIGAVESARRALTMWQGDFVYIADPLAVIQTRDLALIVSRDRISVVRRNRAGGWKYAIVHQLSQAGRGESMP